ncbi:cytochrome P450 1A1-like [Diadema antillarum]|uniref:cytochrome P450 1A1-like n=1 Tax=Diadema antillarum TaxID=105358 RepID=UPI003A88B374
MSESKAKPLPGPWGLPIVGNLLNLGEEPHVAMMKLAREYGNVFQIRLGSRPVVVLCGQEAIRSALVRQAVAFAGRPDLASFQFIRKNSDASVAFQTYDASWKLHRKIAESSIRFFVTGERKSSIESTVTHEVEALIDHWTSNNNEDRFEVDPSDVVKLSVCNVMLWCILGKRHSLDDARLREFVSKSDDFSEAAGSGNIADFMPWIRFMTARTTQNLKKILKTFRGWFLPYIEEHRQQYEQDSEKDILDYVVTSTNKLDDADIDQLGLSREALQIATAFDLFGAGFDTTSATVTWQLYYAVTHPEITVKVQAEIDEIVGRDRLPSLADRDRLPLTQAFLLETFRHSSVVPFTIPHSTISDTNLLGYHVPKDTVVFVNLYSVHHDPETWHQPSVFDPERFIDPETGLLDKTKTEAIMPFGAGRRRCLGAEMGRIQAFLYFAILIHQCEVSDPDKGRMDGKPSFGLTMRPPAFKLLVRKR